MKILKNSNLILSAAIISAGFFISYAIVAQAQESASTFPIAELGNCKNKTECASYCDNQNNIMACVNYAEKQGMISKQDADEARRFAKIGTGPGGCKNKTECASYCDDVSNIDACLDFASKNGLVSPDELEEAKKVAVALKAGAKTPGSCKNKAECESYCNDTGHIDECIDFGEKSGLIPPEELKEAKMAAQAIRAGKQPPGGCKGKKDCDAYCSDSNHMQECADFAIAAGFIPPEEAEQVKKIIPLMKAGKMPGGCKQKTECESYCADESHTDECANFALEAGFMKPEEVEMFKKTGGKGPGGCKGKEVCEAYCNDAAHADECLNFATEKGLIPEAQLQEMKAGKEKFSQGIQMATPEVVDCIKSRVGEDNFAKAQASGMPTREIGAAMDECFGKLMKPPSGRGGGMMPPGAGGSPDGAQGSADRQGPPSREDIQKMMPEGVEVTPEMMKNGPPSQDQIQGMVQQKMREEIEKRNVPPQGEGNQFGPPKGTQQFGPPTDMPSGPPSGSQFGPPAGIPLGPQQ